MVTVSAIIDVVQVGTLYWPRRIKKMSRLVDAANVLFAFAIHVLR